ncbi:MAG: hypothetical protein ACKN9W_16500 [Methylococcus sp.]
MGTAANPPPWLILDCRTGFRLLAMTKKKQWVELAGENFVSLANRSLRVDN